MKCTISELEFLDQDTSLGTPDLKRCNNSINNVSSSPKLEEETVCSEF